MSSAGFIETSSGVCFYPLEPNEDDVCVQDIAHALSHICRFGGHSKAFYSVAEHCVRVSRALDAWDASPAVILHGLLHDASEAYLGDIVSPLKRLSIFSGYREVEEKLQRVICRRFGLPEKEPAIVRKADLVLLATEARDVMPYNPENWGALTEEPLAERITPWSAVEAERAFLIRFASFYGRV